MRQLALVVLAACSAPATSAPAPAPRDDDALRSALSRIAWGFDSPLEQSMRDRPLEEYIDALVADPAFAHYAAYRIMFGPIVDAPSHAVLHMVKMHTFDGVAFGKSQPIYHTTQKCDPKDAVMVRAWWNSDHDIAVCPSAYQPTHLIDPQTGWRCGSTSQVDQLRHQTAQEMSHGEAQYDKPIYCGCGPALANCVPDDATRDHLIGSSQHEVLATTSKLIYDDRPFDEVFTENTTFRDGYADFFYERSRLFAGEIKELPRVDREASFEPRHESWPGEHAGILTTYQFLHMTDGSRDRMRDYFAVAWCKSEGSRGATAQQVNSLGVTDLRHGDGWKQLAAMPICTSCHARLDYGMQFFLGYPASFQGFFDDKKLVATGNGPLYGDDITDARGQAALDPAGFARLLIGQPEFAACMAQRVTRHVLGDAATDEDADALHKLFVEGRRVKPLMREALVRYAKHWSDPLPGALPASSPGPRELAGPLAVPHDVRALVEKHCLDCHDDPKPRKPDLRPDHLPREVVAQMLDRVAWGDMPRDGHLAKVVRDRMVRSLVDMLWPAGATRETAEKYYFGLEALPTHTAAVMRTHFSDPPGALQLENAIDPALIQASPGVLSYITDAALRACKGKTGPELAQCFDEQAAPAAFVKRRP